MNKYALIIHGGAGNITDLSDTKRQKYHEGLTECLDIGKHALKNGSDSVDVVEKCVIYLENNDIFNAGKGSVINNKGDVEMDAAIMRGKDINAGSVIGLMHYEHPISVARAVMDTTEHVMLACEGAEQFAETAGFPKVNNDIFKTEFRIKQAENARKKGKTVLDVEDVSSNSESVTENKKLGTVGAVAMDLNGNISAATSTGGIANKLAGRVGDSPIIGAGVYANNQAGVSATGYGEQFIRSVVSFYAAMQVSDECHAAEACKRSMRYLSESVSGLGGLIMIDRFGNIGTGATSSNLIHGYVGSDVNEYVGFKSQ